MIGGGCMLYCNIHGNILIVVTYIVQLCYPQRHNRKLQNSIMFSCTPPPPPPRTSYNIASCFLVYPHPTSYNIASCFLVHPHPTSYNIASCFLVHPVPLIELSNPFNNSNNCSFIIIKALFRFQAGSQL